jgi:predicted transcriptional regulator
MQRDTEQARIILDILESVDRDGDRSQRGRASEAGMSLGLINAYLKFCIRKGYLKAKKIPARGYRYMLTPKGFAEKSRLALSRLSDSLTFVRATRREYAAVLAHAQERRWTKIVISGSSTLAEICTVCALESGMRIVAIVNSDAQESSLAGVPVHHDFTTVIEEFDGAIVAELENPGGALASAQAVLGETRVLIPPFLSAGLPRWESA